MKTTHSLGAAYLCTLCGYRGFSMRGMKSHLKHAHVDEVSITNNTDEEDLLSKYVKKTKLFDEYETPDADDDASHSTDESEIDVDDCRMANLETEKSKDVSPAPSERNVKRSERKSEGEHSSSVHGQKSNGDGHSAASTSLISKYACQFCAYKSPYKGNVKRHLALVHKMDKEKTM